MCETSPTPRVLRGMIGSSSRFFGDKGSPWEWDIESVCEIQDAALENVRLEERLKFKDW